MTGKLKQNYTRVEHFKSGRCLYIYVYATIVQSNSINVVLFVVII